MNVATAGARDTDVTLNGHPTIRFASGSAPGAYGELTIASQPYVWCRTWQKSTILDLSAGNLCDGGLFTCDDDYNGYIDAAWEPDNNRWHLGPFGGEPFSSADALHSGRETWLAWRVTASNTVKFFVNGVNKYDGAGSGVIAGITKIGINMAAQREGDTLRLGHYEIVIDNPDPYGLL